MTEQENDERPFAEDRWVRIMADTCAEGVWDRDGANRCVDQLPVSPDLQGRILAWQDWYDRCDDEEDPGYADFDRAAFAAEGLAIAKAVKTGLPDWTVIYFDEAKPTLGWKPGQPRDHFEYEITPEMAEVTG